MYSSIFWSFCNYNWQCGRARLPSLSRIINLPMERIFWQFTFLFHIPLRIVEIAVGSYHVVFFYAFGGFATGFFITNVVCHSQSLYYLNPYVNSFYKLNVELNEILKKNTKK
uniref:Very-long-chain (3R)-3-hydroxyacyl-CoA dehydratase n=1 Tax=Meloidogyne incognita TaxID=6306 RepID=A0A914LRF3_MELIC